MDEPSIEKSFRKFLALYGPILQLSAPAVPDSVLSVAFSHGFLDGYAAASNDTLSSLRESESRTRTHKPGASLVADAPTNGAETAAVGEEVAR
jgi:hypothetical protein